MQNLIIGFLLGAVASGIVAFVLGDAENRTATGAAMADASPVPAQAVDARGPTVPVTQEASLERPATIPSAPPAHPTGSDRGTAGPARTAEIPGASLSAQAPPTPPLERLLAAYRIDCQYGPGYGGNWTGGIATPHGAAWQGGLVTFDTIDLVKGTARLKNSSGLTRTLDGELEVRVQATDTGMHFTVFAPGGELIVATVYGMVDEQSKNATVVSFHGPHLNHESAQFYGACTSA